MRACRVHEFGGPEVISIEELATPSPAAGEILVDVRAAGVGPWDAWIRSGKSVLPQPLPLTLGSDLSGLVLAIGEGVTGFSLGDEVYGVTNARFTNACAQQAIASAAMMAKKPRSLDHLAAAAVPVIAVTAWQMLERANVRQKQTIVVHGAAGNVGAFAVQLGKARGARVIATGRERQLGDLRALGADDAIVSDAPIAAGSVDAVLDLVGAAVHPWSFAALKRGGALVSAVSEPDKKEAEARGVQAGFILVAVDTKTLTQLGTMFDENKLTVRIGEVLPLESIALAHRMLDGTAKHADGKIVLRV